MIKVYSEHSSPDKSIWFIEWEPELVHPAMCCHLMNICPCGQFTWHGNTKFSFNNHGGDPKKSVSLETLRGKAEKVYELYTTQTWSCSCGTYSGLKFKDIVCDKCFKPVRLNLLKS